MDQPKQISTAWNVTLKSWEYVLTLCEQTFMGFRSPSTSMAAIFWYHDAARLRLTDRTRLTGSNSLELGWFESCSMEILRITNKKACIGGNTERCIMDN